MRKIRWAAAAATLMILATTGSAGAGLVEQKVRATPVGEYGPFAAEGYLGWYQDSAAKPLKWNAFLKPDGQPKVKLNSDGTQGATGGMDGKTVAFQQFKSKKGISNIRIHDAVAGTSQPAPSKVNTKHWEFWPSISGDWLLFGRQNISDLKYSVMLVNLFTLETRTVGSATKKNWVGPGQVNGNYATFDKCVDSVCNVWLYDIGAGTKTKVPNPADQQYAPSVDEFGTMYFIRSSDVCGKVVRIVRRPLGGPSTVLVALPAERDVQRTFVLTDNTENHVFYDRFKLTTECVWKPLSGNLYKVVDDGGVLAPTAASQPATGGTKSRPGYLPGVTGAVAGR